MAQPVAIIIPVYNAAALLQRCLAALDRCTDPQQARVLVIDDASPDPAIAPLLDAWAAASPLRPRVQRNKVNLGFVGTVNRGFGATRGDALLLNADTEVTPGWLDRMSTALASDPRIATVTPFSNNAEICSWPEFCRATPVPPDPERVARAFTRAPPPVYPDLPTAVGFCMLIRRAALDALGDFDQATFGRGYGEENDFCLRAAGHGWRNVLADDCYVVHAGGGSFAPLGLKPGGDNLARLLARYPRYNGEVAAFIQADPLAPRRAQVAAAYRELCAIA
ncbi:MAG: glycosyltransferase family 2 protein [Rhodanobacteraceae bacterium]|nr:glycosyltransferase family 2 protein [Rhodanobacteraceae bacterium]